MATAQNPFAPSQIPRMDTADPNPQGSTGFRHGSAEQGTGPSYLDYMGGDTPRGTPRSTSPRRSPRGPRSRSMGAAQASRDQEEEDYEARREERRESRTQEPIGISFRLNACEQSLRSHTDELVAQRLAIQELTEGVRQLATDKQATEARLNQVFGLVDQRFAEAQAGAKEIFDGAQIRFQTMAESVTQIASDVMTRLDAINREIEIIRKTPPSSPTYEAPPAPPSWTAGPATGGAATPPHPTPNGEPRSHQPPSHTDPQAPNFGGQTSE